TDSDRIRVVMRADDFGFTNAANQACIRAFREGILTSVEVLVQAPWFLAGAELLRQNPGLDAGVHLALTCEWDNYKWAPLTDAPGLLMPDGFLPVTNEDFDGLNAPLESVEREFRSQIETALRRIPQLSHLSTHMSAPTSTPALRSLLAKLSLEYKLPLQPAGVIRMEGMWGEPIEQKESFLADALSGCGPGGMMFVCHLALDDAETRAIRGTGHDAMTRMAAHRQAETDAVISSTVRKIIVERDILLVGYTGKARPEPFRENGRRDP
ncbi:ChbG/HpnK family deacetylase, partial [bacterium]|nr:ChbG/HpnK family deacetylase [bacterium]